MPNMRLLFFIAFILIVDWYVYQPFLTTIQPFSKWAKLSLSVVYWLIPLVSIIFLVLYHSGYVHLLPGEGGRSLFSALLFLVYICKLVVVPFVLLDDVRRVTQYAGTWIQGTVPHMPGRSRFLSTLGLSVGLLPFTTLLYGIWRNPYRYKVHRIDVPVAGLASELDGLKIVQISDIHSGSFTYPEPVENAIRMINELQPDIVCFTGDLVNNISAEMEPYIPLFSQIKAKHGIYSVLGNHDYGDYARWPDAEAKQANFDQMVQIHQALGWDLLRNEHRVVRIGSEEIVVVGVENYSATPRFPRYGDLNKAILGCCSESPKILLSHDPTHWDAQIVGKLPDIALTLSGHTHGMQFGVEIPGWLKWSPIQYMYKQWAGLYTQGIQHLYVNRGLGFLGYPGRVGILPEITLLELRTA